MKFTDFSKFKDDIDKFLNLAKKGEDVIITKAGKPILSMAGISKEDAEDYILAKYYKLDKKAKSVQDTKVLSHKQAKKHLGI